jgi:hypothetical protein
VPLGLLVFTPVLVSSAILLLGAATSTTVRLVRRVARHRREQATLNDPHRIQLGRDLTGRPISLHENQLGAHGLILGASGSGKSTTLLSITGQQIAAGRPAVIIDLKGSRELERDLAAVSAAARRRLRVWTLDGLEHWNPLAHGNATELKDKLISTERFSEPHYQRAAERYVQVALQVLEELDPEREPSLSTLIDLLEPRRLQNAARRLPAARGAHIQEYVRALGPDQVSAVRGLASRLAVISESHTGRFLEPSDGAIDLHAALGGGDVVLFSLNASSYGRLAAQLGALAVQDLVSAAGARERSGRDMPSATVAIDEFSGLGADHVMALIARGRSAGISVLLATQELADLDRVSRGFRQQVIGSTAVKIAHRQDVSESAWEVARMSGTEKTWEHSWSQTEGGTLLGGPGATSRVNSRLVDRHHVDPSVVQSLRTGEAVVITKLPRSETRLARIRPLSRGAERADAGREH